MTAISEKSPGITDGNQPDTAAVLDHILTDVHEILRRLDAFETEARPLLNAYKGTNGGTMGLLKARKGLRNGS